MRVMLDNGAYAPTRAYSDDAGLDLYTPVDVDIAAGGSAVIDTGVHCAIDSGFYGRIEGKSGLHVKKDIVCHGGTIDASYRGSIAVKLYNHGDKDFHFDAGNKIAQLVICPCELCEVEIVEDLDETERGNGGFGSTGV